MTALQALPENRRGVLTPKNTTSLRAECLPLIGQEFEFTFVGTGDDDEAFPGQRRWIIVVNDGMFGKWWPEEDIRWIEASSA